MYQIGNLQIHVLKKSITNTDAEVIVCSKSPSFGEGPVARAIHNAAGPDVKKEFDLLASKHTSFGPGQNLHTSGGNLKCDYILYAPSKPKDNRQMSVQLQEIQLTVKNTLIQAKMLYASSIAMPAISGGSAGHNPDDVSSTMIRAIEEFSRISNTGSLTTIYLVDINDKILSGWKRFLGALQVQPINTEGAVINVNIQCMSLLDVRADVITCPKSVTMGNGAVGSFLNRAAGNDVQKEVDAIMQRRNHQAFKPGEIAHTGPGRLNFTAILLAPSVPRDSSRALSDQMKDLKLTMKSALVYAGTKLGVRSIALPAISGGAAGYCSKDIATAMIESLVEFTQMPNRGNITTIQLVDLNKDIVKQWKDSYSQLMRYTSPAPVRPETRDSGSIKSFLDSISLPSHWSQLTSGDNGLKLEVLQTSHYEFRMVHDRFKRETDNRLTVDKVTRIQNPSLYRPFELTQEQMKLRPSPPQIIMRELWHGTKGDTIGQINRNGFNRSYCGQNGTRLGRGTYFACSASYSTDKTYSPRGPNGQRYVYLAQVLVGDFITGKGSLREPPSKSHNDPSVRYDSVVDNVSNPSMFVVFHDYQVYPKYLIEFHG